MSSESGGQSNREKLAGKSPRTPMQPRLKRGEAGEQGGENSSDDIRRITHELNNLLTGIMGYANMLAFDAQGGSLSQYAAKSIERSAARAAELSRELMTLGGLDVKVDSKPPSRPIPGTGNILLVDDEEIVASVSADMLRMLGYNVVVASSGDEAVDYYTRFGKDVDLVILDLDMPGMNGEECFQKLKEIDPAVHGILSTGHAVGNNVSHAMGMGVIGIVQKPYALAEVSRIVSEALAEGA